MAAFLDIDIRHRLGDFELAARLVSEGPVTALFGRSGSGKTSIVNVIAGLIHPEAGRVSVNGHILTDTAQRLFVPKHQRRIGYVFQEARLFPHLSVRQNLLYGRWFAHGGGAAEPGLAQVLDLLGIGQLLARRPAELSGGEKQRVAIGRALLARPRLLLMDEPLAALDAERKAEILPYLERLRDEAGIPILYVSHALAEVARLASHVALIEAGEVKAAGPAAAVLARFDLARLAGIAEPSALIEARVKGFDALHSLTQLETPAGPFEIPRTGLAAGSRIRIRILASDVLVGLGRPEGLSALNVVPGRISAIEHPGGGATDLQLDCGGAILVARITAKSAASLGLHQGMQVSAIIKSVAIE